MSDNLSFYESSEDATPVSIVSIPLELGSDERGLAATPNYLYRNGLGQMLRSIGKYIGSEATVTCPKEARVATAGRMKHVRQIASVAKRSAPVVEKLLQRKDKVIVLGGDHSVAFGSLSGALAAHQKLGVIYIDSHPDCNTDETTITGNVHGMVTSTVLGHGHPILTEIPKRHIAPQDMLFIGLKDMDAKEIEFLRENKLQSFTMLDIVEKGFSPVLAAIKQLSKRVDAIWVSMDMDSIDQKDAPGVGLAVPDGFTRREVLALAQYIGKVSPLIGLDIVEMVPAKDVEGKTAGLALELIARFLGAEYTWYQRQYIDTYRETNVTKEGEVVPVRRRQQ